ncbi:MAG: hypothetical protein WBM13_12725 [Bacteroidia bacterium]
MAKITIEELYDSGGVKIDEIKFDAIEVPRIGETVSLRLHEGGAQPVSYLVVDVVSYFSYLDKEQRDHGIRVIVKKKD